MAVITDLPQELLTRVVESLLADYHDIKDGVPEDTFDLESFTVHHLAREHDSAALNVIFVSFTILRILNGPSKSMLSSSNASRLHEFPSKLPLHSAQYYMVLQCRSCHVSLICGLPAYRLAV